jgi:hypothetical protein
MAANIEGALNNLFSTVVVLRNGFASYRVGKSDVSFHVTRYMTHLYPGERRLMERGVLIKSCRQMAHRLLELYSAVAEWFLASKLRTQIAGEHDRGRKGFIALVSG